MKDSLYYMYGKAYKDMVYEIFRFFIDSSIKSRYLSKLRDLGVNESLNYKCVLDFILANPNKYYRETSPGTPIQPYDVDRICRILVDNGFISKVDIPVLRNLDGNMNFYVGVDKGVNEMAKEPIIHLLNCVVYGFDYIFDEAKKYVFPLVVRSLSSGEEYVGTCFKTRVGFVTAKHCLANYDHFSINGEEFRMVKQARIIYHEVADLALIDPKKDGYDDGYFIEKEVPLSNVIALGYPKLSGFEEFLTGTLGSVSSVHYSYVNKCDLILVTCPVRGGNSGGPVLNQFGNVIGIITDIPDFRGDKGLYDNFGYGIATPIRYLNDLEI